MSNGGIWIRFDDHREDRDQHEEHNDRQAHDAQPVAAEARPESDRLALRLLSGDRRDGRGCHQPARRRSVKADPRVKEAIEQVDREIHEDHQDGHGEDAAPGSAGSRARPRRSS